MNRRLSVARPRARERGFESPAGCGVPSARVLGAKQADVAPPAGYVFLSPEWIHEAVRVAESARGEDVYFRNLASGFNFSLGYRVRDIPGDLKEPYGGGSEAAVFVELQGGSARRVRVGAKLPSEKIHLLVTSDYLVAKKLFLGESSALASFLHGKLRVEPASGFHQWAQLATKGVLAANMFLRFARQVPTLFAPAK